LPEENILVDISFSVHLLQPILNSFILQLHLTKILSQNLSDHYHLNNLNMVFEKEISNEADFLFAARVALPFFKDSKTFHSFILEGFFTFSNHRQEVSNEKYIKIISSFLISEIFIYFLVSMLSPFILLFLVDN